MPQPPRELEYSCIKQEDRGNFYYHVYDWTGRGIAIFPIHHNLEKQALQLVEIFIKALGGYLTEMRDA